MNGASSSQPSARAAAFKASMLLITSSSGRSETSPAIGQTQFRRDLSIGHGDLAALQLFQFLDRAQNVRVICPDDDDVVRIVRHRRTDARRASV